MIPRVWVLAFLIGLVVSPAAAQIYVKWDAPGANNGSSWTDAYTDLQSALGAAVAGDEIWVAAGTYTPTAGTDRSASFSLQNQVEIYGGFDGNETARNQRDWATNVTILSGDIGLPADSSDNSEHVVVGSGTDASAVLDGFTIRDGYCVIAGNGAGVYINNGDPALANLIVIENYSWIGGGVYLYRASPSLSNVRFEDNHAERGGGMYCDTDCAPNLTDCEFYDNAAVNGGGMFNDNNSDPVLVDVLFDANHANASNVGSGMYNRLGSGPVFLGVIFTNNDSGGALAVVNNGRSLFSDLIIENNSGNGFYSENSEPVVVDANIVDNGKAGIYSDASIPSTDGGFYLDAWIAGNQERGLYTHAPDTLVNCVFYKNVTSSGGGGVRTQWNSPVFVHCTFTANVTNPGGCCGYGGAIFSHQNNPLVFNSILWANSANYGAGIWGPATASNSIVQGFGTSGSIVDADPQFVDRPNGDLRLLSTSPAIDLGTAAAPALPADDFDGTPRTIGAAPDAGAYEYPIPLAAGDRTPSSAEGIRAAYPNPFNPSITIWYYLAYDHMATVAVYDVGGRQIRRLVEGTVPRGMHEIRWDGRSDAGTIVSSGVYVVRFAGDGVDSRKILLLK